MATTALETLSKFASRMDAEVLTKQDFVDNFEKVINLILKIQEEQKQSIIKLEETYQILIERINKDHSDNFNILKGQVNDVFVGERLEAIEKKNEVSLSELKRIVNELTEKKLREIDERMRKVRDGRTPIKGVDYFDGKHADDILPEQLVAKITKKLSIDDLKDLRGELLKFRKEIDAIPRGGSRGKVPIIKRYDLTSQVNGTTKTFTLPIDTMDVIGVFGSQFPINFEPNVDWKFTNGNLVLQGNVSAPTNGQTLYAIIEQLFY